MPARFFVGVLLLASASAADTRLVRETDPLTPEQERAALHVPDGFEVQLFASEPMINKPINMAFDARGRLWVSSTVEYPYSADKSRWADAQGTRVKDSRDAIKILEDSDGDGRADKVIDFADGLNIPTGVLPWRRPGHKAGCIAWSIPNIWYFGDSDGDDKADVREVLFGPLGYEKDTHGMCSSFRLGLDGWIYATHGFNNSSHFKAKGGSTLDLHSGNVFRFRPDASRVEIWSHGQVNPFGLCFDRHHNLYSADCHSAPVYQLLRGAHYPSFGKPHDGLGFGPSMCDHSHGSTGICGIAYVDSGIWGPDWDDHVFIGNVVTSRVNADHITFAGSTPKANERPDLVASDDPWFRPVDLQLGPDNALYIADFYNRIIGHYEVPLEHPGRDRERGRIWKVVKKGASASPRVVRPLFVGKSESERLAALADSSPFVQRAALGALQDEPTLAALPALLRFTLDVPKEDVQLLHAARLTLRDHLSLPGAFSNLPSTGDNLLLELAPAVPSAEAAAYLLRRLPAKAISSKALRHAARYGDEAILTEALNIGKQWAGELPMKAVEAIEALHGGLSERGATPPAALLQWAQEVASGLLDRSAKTSWETVSQDQPTPNWSLADRKCADGSDIRVLQSMRGGGAEEKLTGILRSRAFAAPERLRFWINGHRGFPQAAARDANVVRLVDAATHEVLASCFPPRSDTCEPVEWDLAGNKGRQVRLELVDGDSGSAYAWLGVGRISPPVISVEEFESQEAHQSALRSLAVLLQHTAPVVLRERLAAYLPPRPTPPPLPVNEEQQQQLNATIADRVRAFKSVTPDPAKGEQVFTANCAVCHQVGGKGGLIGPQLDGIGNRGLERLCEDILDPNRNVDAHFHLHVLKLRDGLTISGFLKAEAGQVLVIADAAGQEHRVAKADVAEDQTVPISLMPPVFGQSIPEQDFVQLLAWLLQK